MGSGEVSTSSDGKTIYFVSDKKKGIGANDIYVAHQNKSGVWGKAINLGPLVNTPFNEGSPKIYDASILFSLQMDFQVMEKQMFLNVK